MISDIGVYYDLVSGIASSLEPPILSYLSRDWPDVEQWRRDARAKVHELMAFEPPEVPLDPRVHSTTEYEGLVIEEVSYEMPYGPRAHGLFAYPEGRNERLPAVLALHDHGGFKYYGKEKVCWARYEPPILRKFKEEAYGGRSWATELAKRGFAVLCVDLFMWGSRRVRIEDLGEEVRARFEGLAGDSEESIAEYNRFAGEHEHTVAKTILAAGSTLQGVFSYDDRRSVEYLLTRPEVDPERVGCGGLSGGGLRTVFLAGLDPRIKCAVCIGFMNTFKELLRNHIKCHTWMLYLPHLPRYLDLPDLLALRATGPLMVQYNTEDELFTPEGQRSAHERIAAIYQKMGEPGNYSGNFYPGPHKFDVQMQQDAFDWFEKWLC